MKSMDLFLIAGQSNAVGYSPICDGIDGIFEGFYYAGQTDIPLPDAGAASEIRPAEYRTRACGVLYDRFIHNFAAVFRKAVAQGVSPTATA